VERPGRSHNVVQQVRGRDRGRRCAQHRHLERKELSDGIAARLVGEADIP
jgi:hypothetical protein